MAKTQIDLFGKEDIESLHTLNKAKRSFNAKEIETIKTKTGFSLLRNVQFIYELALAKKELLAFGLDFHVANDFRIFDVPSSQNAEVLKRRLAYFESINGIITDYYYINRYPRLYRRGSFIIQASLVLPLLFPASLRIF